MGRPQRNINKLCSKKPIRIYLLRCLFRFIEEFYGVNVTIKGRESFKIFKYLVKNKIESLSLDPVNFKRGHPFLKYTDEIRNKLDDKIQTIN